jgi:hypothetical protein
VSKTHNPTIYIQFLKSHHKKRQKEKKSTITAKTRPAKGGRRWWSRRYLVAVRAFLLREGERVNGAQPCFYGVCFFVRHHKNRGAAEATPLFGFVFGYAFSYRRSLTMWKFSLLSQ